ncbi:MAG: S8 family serine peptidase [Maricaulaceae bacterium]|jgi:serine protease
MRTLLVGLIGGALVFTFFWYRGDTGPIELPGLGVLAPPEYITPMDRLAAAPPALRAVRAEFAPPPSRRAAEAVAPEIYAGMLIAKPRAVVTADAAAAAQPDAAPDAADEEAPVARLAPNARIAPSVRSLAVSRQVTPLSNAMRIANEVGSIAEVRSTGAMVINLDYDLMDEVAEEEAAAIEPDTDTDTDTRTLRAIQAPSRLRLLPSVAPQQLQVQTDQTRTLAAPRTISQQRPIAFDAGEQIRERVMRTQARRLAWAEDRCPDDVDAEMMRANPRIGVNCAIERLRASNEFEYVEPNYIVTHEFARRPRRTAGATGAPDDPLYGLQWNYTSQGGNGGAGEGDGETAALSGGAGFQDFWARTEQHGSREIVVAVVDTGLDTAHPDISGSPNVATGIDMVSVAFYGNDGDGRDTDPSDPGDICDTTDPEAANSYHGTHVAGTIGAASTNDGAGIAGGAWDVTIVPVRALGRCGGLQSDINDAIRWAAGVEEALIETPGGVISVANENPADIINLSLGFPAPDGCPASTQEAINDAIAAGAIVVAAAGNKGIDVAEYGPSGCDGVLTVAAGDGVGALAYYSNWGEGVDVMAPGGDLSADLDGDGRPDGILSTKRAEDCVDPLSSEAIGDCRYAYEHGTSMAAPHVSAALALLKSQDPARSNDTLIDLIVNNARNPRSLAQCTGLCSETPGGTTIDGQPGMCHRPCGEGLLDLAQVAGE